MILSLKKRYSPSTFNWSTLNSNHFASDLTFLLLRHRPPILDVSLEASLNSLNSLVAHYHVVQAKFKLSDVQESKVVVSTSSSKTIPVFSAELPGNKNYGEVIRAVTAAHGKFGVIDSETFRAHQTVGASDDMVISCGLINRVSQLGNAFLEATVCFPVFYSTNVFSRKPNHFVKTRKILLEHSYLMWSTNQPMENLLNQL
jgi:hypothetical protein